MNGLKNYRFCAGAMLWFVLIMYLSFANLNKTIGAPMIPFQDKIGHFVIYAIFTYLLGFAFLKELHLQRFLVWATGISMLVGLGVEIGQHYGPSYREGSVGDLIFNILGTVTCVIYVSFFLPKKVSL